MKRRLEHESKLLQGFGAVKPHKRPEDWAKIRVEVETLIANDAARRGQRTDSEKESQ